MDINIVECLSRIKHHINSGILFAHRAYSLKTEPLVPKKLQLQLMADCLLHLIIYLNVDCLSHKRTTCPYF